MQQLEVQGEKARYVHGKISALYPASYWLAVLDTLRFTGIRFNQLLHLKLSDVNVDMGYIDLCLEGSKTHREWRIPVVGPLRARLRILIRMAKEAGAEPGDFLFDVNRFIYNTRPEGKYAYSEKSAYQKIRSFFRRLSTIQGYNVTPHRFRHTLATELMKSPDRNLHMVKDLLGHQNLATTMEYVEIELSIVRETLERELRLHTDLNEQEITGNVMNF